MGAPSPASASPQAQRSSSSLARCFRRRGQALLKQAVKALGEPAPQCGSQVVLERLWTAEQLRGTPADGRTTRLRPADHVPPEPLPPDPTVRPSTRWRARRFDPAGAAPRRRAAGGAHLRSLRTRRSDRRLRRRDRRLSAPRARPRDLLRRRQMDAHACRAGDAAHRRSAVRGRQPRVDARESPGADRRQGRGSDRLDAAGIRAIATELGRTRDEGGRRRRRDVPHSRRTDGVPLSVRRRARYSRWR